MTDPIREVTHRPTFADPTEHVAPAPGTIELDVETIVTPAPFHCVEAPAKEALFVDGISPSDVRQGGVGDCTLQASLASIARTAAGKDFLRSHVRELRDSAGSVSAYAVSIFRKNESGGYEPAMIDVPAGCLASRGFAHAVDATGASEMWPRVYEQAMLRANGGVPVSNMPDATSILTGRPATDVPTSIAGLSGKLAHGFATGKAQVLSTTGKVLRDLDDPKLKAAHAYTLVGIQARALRNPDGSYSVEELYELRNPWGYDNPPPLTLEQVQKYFSTYSEGNVP